MICGIDEAGRGPLAGPVCAAAVVLPAHFPVKILNDSKKLTRAQRERAATVLYAQAVAWGLGWATHKEIDEINILQASLLAMRRAFFDMLERAKTSQIDGLLIKEAIVDGTFVPDIPIFCRAIVKADATVSEVMAASILAKTARDQEMERFAALYPQYGYEKHKGYPTREHVERIIQYGPSPIQRKTFRVTGWKNPALNK
jgi:ribonuclease HII